MRLALARQAGRDARPGHGEGCAAVGFLRELERIRDFLIPSLLAFFHALRGFVPLGRPRGCFGDFRLENLGGKLRVQRLGKVFVTCKNELIFRSRERNVVDAGLLRAVGETRARHIAIVCERLCHGRERVVDDRVEAQRSTGKGVFGIEFRRWPRPHRDRVSNIFRFLGNDRDDHGPLQALCTVDGADGDGVRVVRKPVLLAVLRKEGPEAGKAHGAAPARALLLVFAGK